MPLAAEVPTIPKTRLVRLPERSGLIRAKVIVVVVVVVVVFCWTMRTRRTGFLNLWTDILFLKCLIHPFSGGWGGDCNRGGAHVS